jgi:uncharacterized protein (DUF1697 family)
MGRLIALLRGINVGGNKKLPMAELRELVTELGHRDVRTYVQSGNVVFTAASPDASAERVAAEIEAAIERRFGFGARITIRTRDELAAVIAADPFKGVADREKAYHVFFLAEEVSGEGLDELDADSFLPERWALRGRELYVWTPDGIGTSPLAKKLSEKRIGTRATARNWRTVRTLLEMADAA